MTITPSPSGRATAVSGSRNACSVGGISNVPSTTYFEFARASFALPLLTS